jgi:hypothetical protein
MSNTYTDVFTGGPINPTPTSEAKYILTESITLSWPQSGVETSNIVANIMEISTENGAFTITMPDATMVSVGQSMIFRNVGDIDIDILKNDGTALATISATPEINVVWLYVNDNSTVAGGWGVMNYGTATSSADAATLAGYGLIPISTTLNVDMETKEIDTDYDLTEDDRGKLIVWTGGNGDIYLPSSESVGNGFIVSFKNRSNVSGQFSLVPVNGDNIDTFTTEYNVSDLESLSLIADGLDSWNSVGFGKDTIFAVSILNLNVNSIVSEYTLSGVEASKYRTVSQYYFLQVQTNIM